MSHLCPQVEKAFQSLSPNQYPQQTSRLQMVYHLAAIPRPAWPPKYRPEQTHPFIMMTATIVPGLWHLLQPTACAVQAVGLRLYMHQLGCLHKVLCIAMPSNERGVRKDGCPSIHHLPQALAWPQEARSNKKMGNRTDKLKQMRKIKTIQALLFSSSPASQQ